MIEAVAVIVPVHDEAAMLPRCLAALDRALVRLPDTMRRCAVVVLDACSDGSAAIARDWTLGAASERARLTLAARNVGHSRAAGAAHALAMLAAPACTDAARPLAVSDPARVWLATTDADSIVPPDWLLSQLALADVGADAIAGSIQVDDWHSYPAHFGARFDAFYQPPGSGDAHDHVHGANLGVRADAYLQIGGFAPLTTGEDHDLWRALQLAGRRCVSSRRVFVTTSARRVARAPAGFSSFLAAMLEAG